MPRMLWLKAVRDVRANAGQFAAAFFVAALGCASFLGMLSSYYNLSASYGVYYTRCHLANFQVEFSWAPSRLARRVQRLPGVVAALGRIVADIPLEQPGRQHRRIECRIISLPERPEELVNNVLILRGRRPLPGRREVLLEKRFADFNGYRIGDRVTFLVAGIEVPFTVVGLAVSPEYIYPVRSREYLVPSPSTFGIAFLLRAQAEDLLGRYGMINNLAVRCQPERRAALMAQVRRLTRPYGTKDPEPREKQPSYYLLNMDLQGYKQMATIFPSFLLFAAALAIYTVLRRMVESQRSIIGMLRASGYTGRQIAAHYAAVPAIVGLLSGLAGIALGQLLAIFVTRLYLAALNIPLAATPMRWNIAAASVLLGTAACVLGGLAPALSTARLAPAEALRDAPSAAGRRLLLEAIISALRRASALAKLPLRNIARRPARTAWAASGIAAACMLIVMSGSWADAADELIQTYFRIMRRYDFALAFQIPQTAHQVFRAANLPGVHIAEPMLSVPVKLIHGPRSETTSLVGLPQNCRLVDLRGLDGRRLPLRHGVILANRLLRKKLALSTGDIVLIQYAFQTPYRRGELRAIVGPPLRLPVGMSIYMPIDDVRRAFRDCLDLPPSAINSVLIRAAKPFRRFLQNRLYSLPWAAAVTSVRDEKRDLEEELRFLYVFIDVLTAFGVSVALSVIYATVLVSTLERRRELASLRAEGLPFARVAILVTAENAIIWLLGCTAGLPLGDRLARALLATYVTESLELTPVVYPRTFILAAAATLAAVLLSQLPALRYIRRLNLAAVLRYRD